jgi:hypothetical protein
MVRRTLTPMILIALLAACSHDGPAGPDGPQFSKGGGGGGGAGGGGGQTTYAYSLDGDIMSSGAPTARMKTTSPFANLTVDGFTVDLGSPTGEISACRTGSGEYVDDFAPGEAGPWTGTLKVATNGTLSFLGNNVDGATLQFSIADATGGAQQTVTGGVYRLEYTDARLYFGGNSTAADGKYRCVNVVLTATPA